MADGFDPSAARLGAAADGFESPTGPQAAAESQRTGCANSVPRRNVVVKLTARRALAVERRFNLHVGPL